MPSLPELQGAFAAAIFAGDSRSEALLAQVGDRFLLPLSDVDPQAKAILSNANLRTSWGSYASADLTAQADAIYFVRNVNAD